MVKRTAFAYRGCKFTKMNYISHDAMLSYALHKARFNSTTEHVIMSKRDVSEAVIIGREYLNTKQPLRQWNSSLVDEEEVTRFMYDQWQHFSQEGRLGGVRKKRFYKAVLDEFNMQVSPSTVRKYLSKTKMMQEKKYEPVLKIISA